MACVLTADRSELEFVRGLTRRAGPGDCLGPLVRLLLCPERVFLLERIFDSQAASDTLWSGYRQDTGQTLEFVLCAAHWLDLACFVWARGFQHRRRDVAQDAKDLLQAVCFGAQWDAKEIVNMFAWQRARLT